MTRLARPVTIPYLLGMTPEAGDPLVINTDGEVVIGVGGGGGVSDHALLTNVTTSQHHVRYSDAEAIAAVGTPWDALDVNAFWNGTIRETFDALVTESGGVVTMSLEQSGGGDLTMRFSDGETTLDCTPAATIVLTAGTDSVPQENFVYIPQSTKVLTLSTTAWPAGEHIKVSYFFLPSAARVSSDGAYVNQNWNDHEAGTDGQGHLAHVAERSRRLGAQYHQGVDGAGTTSYLTITAGSTFWKSTAGVIYQLHKHTFPANDMSGGDHALVVNQNGAPYTEVTDLFDIDEMSDGTTIGLNKWFSLVFWGVANKSGTYEPIMVNLPSGVYNSQVAADTDDQGYANYDIPAAFGRESSTGFLICRIVVKMSTTWVYGSTVDLRGVTPQAATGGGSGGSVVVPDSSLRIYDDLDPTKLLAFQVSGVTTGNTRELTIPDKDGTIALLSDIGSSGSPLTTKGDLYVFTTVDARLPIGTDTFVLTADSGEASGVKWAAAGGVPPTQETIFVGDGPAVITTSSIRIYSPVARTISKVRTMCEVAPSGGALTADVHKDGTTIFTTQANRPSVADAAYVSARETPDVTTWAADSYIQVLLDEVNGAEGVAVIIEWSDD